MKYVLNICDLCKKEERFEAVGNVQSNTWVERKGRKPVIVRDEVANTKWFKPANGSVIFCSDKCNQTHKEIEAVAMVESHKAWMLCYNARVTNALG